MKKILTFLSVLIIITSCENKEKKHVKVNGKQSKTELIKKTKKIVPEITIEQKIENTKKDSINGKENKNVVSNWKHPNYFTFKDYEEFKITDTIKIDLNGNGISEKVFFDFENCTKLIIKGKDSKPIEIGCGKNDYEGFPNAMGWVNLWCVVKDKETFEIIIKDGKILGDRIVKLERPSLYVGKEEAGGGIITYKNGKLYWIHQAD